jgi:hypothetical protein
LIFVDRTTNYLYRCYVLIPNDKLPNDKLPNDKLPNDKLPNAKLSNDDMSTKTSISTKNLVPFTYNTFIYIPLNRYAHRCLD